MQADLITGTKICSKCKLEQPISNFGKHKGNTDELQYWCNTCKNKNKIKNHPKPLKPKVKAGYKICAKCGLELPESKFGPDKNNKDGLYSWCKLCKNISNTDRNKIYNQSLHGKYSRYKARAKYKKVEFSLTLKQFATFWKKPCTYGCYIETIGLDRIDNNFGYKIENVQPMCERHNEMKNNMSLEEFLSLCVLVVNKR